MLLIVGLGNPGAEYKNHRHNVGFMAVDAIARANGFSSWSRKFQGEISEGRLGANKVLLLKPLTYMNVSGQSVAAAASFYKLTEADIIVIHDELDLDPGRCKVKTGGGNGGHNGLKSIDAHMGKDYKRLRLGIGHPGHKDRVNPYVLGDFSKADQIWLEPLLDAIAKAAPDIATGDGANFMNKITLATRNDIEPQKVEVAKPKAQSHIRQARSNPIVKIPETGPMAAMLKKLLGHKKED
ncbi:MAG: aminoacyl-tRNA hydrolase [Notoacmeibacter sp.]